MILGTATFLILAIALIVDFLVGDPDAVWKRFPHPVVIFGKSISWCDARFNQVDATDGEREKLGFISIAVLLILAILTGSFLSRLLIGLGWLGFAIEVVIVAIFLAQKSLVDHVRAVADGLRHDGLPGGRDAVARIVGRKPDLLDETGVCRAAIETLAENASDGVVAPAFWYAIFGLPGLFAYKVLNTADSMIGHKNEKYRAFGKASARFDDFANYVPARLTGLLIVLAGGLTDIEDNFSTMRTDAKLHRSPNAGWPESGMAAVTGLALGGPRIYVGDAVDEPFMNDAGRKIVDETDIDRAISVFQRAMAIGLLMVVLLAWIVN